MSDLVKEFVWDSRDHLATAQNQLLELEQDPSSLQRLNALMGTLHTIKGNSGFVTLRHLDDLLHAAESLLQTVRELSRDCPRPVVDSLFQVLDTSEAIMGRLEKDEDDEVDWMPSLMEALADVCRSLEAGGDGTASPPDREPGRPAGAPAPSPDAGPDKAPDPLPDPEIREGRGPASPPSAGGNGSSLPPFGPADAIQTLSLTNGRMGEEGAGYLAGSQEILKNGAKGLILDMRELTSFTVPEARIFRELRSCWGVRLAVLASREQQPDLCRIFDIMEPQGFSGIFPSEDAARIALMSG
ncbi:MAG: Hpt domain-containing protein [Deltaproteobacteria bacterium]|jgi:two-component system chemotaxis sensor kinase CheA|nr:Hpt domain-containing protein [Deltaproteobacteria bacterium]